MNITIDGIMIEAFPGETVMTAAKRAGIFIPGLCYDEATGGSNSCRLCMVEIEGKDKNRLVAACAFLAKDEMSVITNTERVKRIRKTLLELMYLQAPDNPKILELMEKCNVVPETSLAVKDPIENGLKGCILCGRCVNACKSLGAAAISTISRGVDKNVNTPYGKAADVCIGCAACAEACPIHAIQVQDTEDGRKIWNKNFVWVRCQSCGKIITTAEHYRAIIENLEKDEREKILCPDCKRKNVTEVFAL
ncbi:MAG: 2Fe-2S iron-sulfur cluster-binding protein [Anaerovoracaceae bacterium]|jgi:bidirectional [NiFe] hydrogenase diaphorase subunit